MRPPGTRGPAAALSLAAPLAVVLALALGVTTAAIVPGGGAGSRTRSAAGLVSGTGAAGRGTAAARKAPVFAYYYMWMHGSYWTTHKLDHPVRPFPGNYNSADPAVIRWQIRQAEAAGITGFIVSWKDTPLYRTILPRVEAAASRAHFKLAMEYEGLNAARRPLPLATVAAGFRYFAATYASGPAWYRVHGKPLTIWHGTNGIPLAEVAAVTRQVRSRILVLSAATSTAEFSRLAPATDGDAYYWSSVDPARDRNWPAKLAAMAAAVHRAHKIWVAPFAPGFNATLIGGHRVIPRLGGATLRLEYRVAARSAPDILGLISWNEWTENTYVEPSVNYRYSYVRVLKNLINRR